MCVVQVKITSDLLITYLARWLHWALQTAKNHQVLINNLINNEQHLWAPMTAVSSLFNQQKTRHRKHTKYKYKKIESTGPWQLQLTKLGEVCSQQNISGASQQKQCIQLFQTTLMVWSKPHVTFHLHWVSTWHLNLHVWVDLFIKDCIKCPNLWSMTNSAISMQEACRPLISENQLTGKSTKFNSVSAKGEESSHHMAEDAHKECVFIALLIFWANCVSSPLPSSGDCGWCPGRQNVAKL